MAILTPLWCPTSNINNSKKKHANQNEKININANSIWSDRRKIISTHKIDKNRTIFIHKSKLLRNRGNIFTWMTNMTTIPKDVEYWMGLGAPVDHPGKHPMHPMRTSRKVPMSSATNLRTPSALRTSSLPESCGKFGQIWI